MRTMLDSWRAKVPQRLLIRVGIVFLCGCGVALIVIIALGYWLNWDWTGLGTYNLPLNNSNLQRGKTLWDWLQLLIVPVMLALGGVWFNQMQKDREQQATNQQAALERELALDSQQEVLLQAYIDKMAELLVEKHLRTSQQDDEVRDVARVRTLLVLSRLDGRRKGSVLRFLYESGLIKGVQPIIRLQGADLSDTDMREANLYQANLRQANLRRALLGRADLREALLSRTDLQEANLYNTILQEADLTASDLRSADLTIADLHGALLTGVDLRDAVISSTQIASARSAEAILTS